MCVAAVAWDAHPDWLLVCAGNRDEYHARPAAPLSRWPNGIIAGTDLTGGGTWLGVTGTGRMTLVTNYRTPEGAQPGRPSRGRLVTDLLSNGLAHQDRTGAMAEMNAFNLILVEKGQALFVTNHPVVETRPLMRGIHGLSNGGFDIPWPKTLLVNSAVASWLAAGDRDTAPLFAALSDETVPSLATLEQPETRFAPVFIRDSLYGTRCSTVVAVNRQGHGTIEECRFDSQGHPCGQTRIAFTWPV
ncbi:NRDE family protein [Novosphingobium panipatense]|jgi:uncharacterized protein with NRDE domain|uniref:NRDE family protein n=1 Tax=Novosphingobium TaxID=165696 RepID=UPI000CDB99D0|nr:NRDE family protein [Novosphingobium sp. HII-3]